MKFKIIGDSCCDFTAEQIKKDYFYSIPLTITVGGVDVIDDDTFNQAKFLDMMAACPECPKSSCPSPEKFMDSFSDAEDIYIVTLSAKLSGSYNSARLAKQMFQEEHPDVNIHIFDSKSAAAGEQIIVAKLEELALKGYDFKTIVTKTEDFISRRNTVFVLEDLEVMRKNGRLSKLKAVVANVLNIKPVLIGVDGEIQQYDQARGMNKALNRLLYFVEKQEKTSTTAYITTCESIERCKNVRKILIEKLGFKKVIIIEARGISAMYMNRGGVVLSF